MTYSPRSPHPGFIAARKGFLAGTDSPRDFLERGISAIEARDGEVRAFVTTRLDAARKDADAASARYKEGHPLSLLDGCPLAVKDMISNRRSPHSDGAARCSRIGRHLSMLPVCTPCVMRGLLSSARP